MEKISVLNSEIPSGGYGRPLTSGELKNIRRAGFPCSTGWIVLRVMDSPSIGLCYRPSPAGGFDSTNIKVTTK